MTKLLLLALLLTGTLAYLSLRQKRVKFEIEFEMEPKDGGDDAGADELLRIGAEELDPQRAS